jgi:hypothetical protein
LNQPEAPILERHNRSPKDVLKRVDKRKTVLKILIK